MIGKQIIGYLKKAQPKKVETKVNEKKDKKKDDYLE